MTKFSTNLLIIICSDDLITANEFVHLSRLSSASLGVVLDNDERLRLFAEVDTEGSGDASLSELAPLWIYATAFRAAGMSDK